VQYNHDRLVIVERRPEKYSLQLATKRTGIGMCMQKYRKAKLEGHSVERMYLRQRCFDGSVKKTIVKPRVATAAGRKNILKPRLVTSSMSRHLSTRNISSKSVHAFLSNLANRQTDKQTNKHGQKPFAPPLSEVITHRIHSRYREHRSYLSVPYIQYKRILSISQVGLSKRGCLDNIRASQTWTWVHFL